MLEKVALVKYQPYCITITCFFRISEIEEEERNMFESSNVSNAFLFI